MTALPGPIVDLIREGATPRDLRTRGERAVWAALVSTAASAVQRGWTRPEWTALVLDPRSHLGTQARLRRGRAARTDADVEKQLTRAWTKATTWLTEAPAAFGPAEILTAIRGVREKIADPDADLTDVQRAILDYACTVAAEKMTTRPALPRRAVMAATGLSERVVRDALERMDRDGLLVCEVRGKPDPAKRRASLYRLPAPNRIPVSASGPVGRSAQVYGTPEVDKVGTREQTYGTCRRVRLTIEADDADSLDDLLHRLTGAGHVVAVEDEPPANVVPLRGRHAS